MTSTKVCSGVLLCQEATIPSGVVSGQECYPSWCFFFHTWRKRTPLSHPTFTDTFVLKSFLSCWSTVFLTLTLSGWTLLSFSLHWLASSWSTPSNVPSLRVTVLSELVWCRPPRLGRKFVPSFSSFSCTLKHPYHSLCHLKMTYTLNIKSYQIRIFKKNLLTYRG